MVLPGVDEANMNYNHYTHRFQNLPSSSATKFFQYFPQYARFFSEKADKWIKGGVMAQHRNSNFNRVTDPDFRLQNNWWYSFTSGLMRVIFINTDLYPAQHS